MTSSTPDVVRVGQQFNRLTVVEDDSEEEIVIEKRKKVSEPASTSSQIVDIRFPSAVCSQTKLDEHCVVYACVTADKFQVVFVPWYSACSGKVTNWRGGSVSDQRLVELLYNRHVHFHWYSEFMTLNDEDEFEHQAGPKKLAILQTIDACRARFVKAVFTKYMQGKLTGLFFISDAFATENHPS